MGGHRFIHRVPIIQLGGMQLKAALKHSSLYHFGREGISLLKKHTVSLYTGCDFFPFACDSVLPFPKRDSLN